jgi:hypothetical protein
VASRRDTPAHRGREATPRWLRIVWITAQVVSELSLAIVTLYMAPSRNSCSTAQRARHEPMLKKSLMIQ